MNKIAIFDDHEAYGEMLAGPLLRAGHSVLIELAPMDFERILNFRPDVLGLALYRKKAAFDRPIQSIEQDVVGYKPLVEMEAYPAIRGIPTLLLGNALQEKDVPTSINYDLFLTLPDDIALFVPKIEELANVVKTRRKISNYICPVCGSRLTFAKLPAKDLFCPRCHTSVAIVRDHFLYMVHGQGETLNGKLADIRSLKADKEFQEANPTGKLFSGD